MSGALELDGDDPQIKEIADKFFEGKEKKREGCRVKG